MGVDPLDGDLQLRHAAVDVRELGSKLGHGVAVFHVLAGEVVELVEVLRVASDDNLTVALLDAHNGLEHVSVTVLDELSHRVEVCGEVDGGREYSFQILAFRLAVELLPPLSKVLELRIVGNQDLYLLAKFRIEQVPHRRVLYRRVLLAFHRESLLHLDSAGDHLAHIESRQHDRQKSDRSEDGEPASHVVRNDKCLVAFLCGEGLEGPL